VRTRADLFESGEAMTGSLIVEEILHVYSAVLSFLELTIDIGSSTVEPSLEVLFDGSGVWIVKCS